MKNKIKKSMKVTFLIFIIFILLPVFATAQKTDLDYIIQGTIHLDVYEFDEAIADFTKAIELNPKNPFAYGVRGEAYFNKDQFDQAIADLTKALELDPYYARAYGLRGEAYFNKDQYDQAISDLSKALDLDHENLDPKNADYIYVRGCAYYKKGQYDKAIADYTNAIEISHQTITDPNTDIGEIVALRMVLHFIYHLRGKAYLKKGLYDQALSDANKAIKLNPKSADAYGLRGEAYFRKGQYDQAIADYTEAIELDPRTAKAYGLRGEAYFRKGQYDQAIADNTKALELSPKNSFAYGFRGKAYLKKGQYDQAIADCTHAIELGHQAIADPNTDIGDRFSISMELDSIYHSRGKAYLMKGQYDQALSDANKAIELGSDWDWLGIGRVADAYLLKGMACEKLKRNKEAIEAYKNYIKYSKDVGTYFQDADKEEVKKRIDELEKQQ